MGWFGKIREQRWFKFITNTYVLILLLFVAWMFFFDSNSYLIHRELNQDIEALEENKEFYQTEIEKDRAFIERMKDSFELEKFAREKYYLKRENEDIYIIENGDSLKNDQHE